MRAGVMMANMSWKAMNAWAGTVGAYEEGAAPTPGLPTCFRAVNFFVMSAWEDEDFCYVTTTGRRTGNPHQIEIWFGSDGDTIYLLSGGGDRSDWFKNLRADPAVLVRIGDQEWR